MTYVEDFVEGPFLEKGLVGGRNLKLEVFDFSRGVSALGDARVGCLELLLFEEDDLLQLLHVLVQEHVLSGRRGEPCLRGEQLGEAWQWEERLRNRWV